VAHAVSSSAHPSVCHLQSGPLLLTYLKYGSTLGSSNRSTSQYSPGGPSTTVPLYVNLCTADSRSSHGSHFRGFRPGKQAGYRQLLPHNGPRESAESYTMCNHMRLLLYYDSASTSYSDPKWYPEQAVELTACGVRTSMESCGGILEQPGMNPATLSAIAIDVRSQ
jgi:hypothetical protein